jgi:hypothetical protein
VLNISWIPFIWYFYVETAGLSLEEIDLMFETKYHGGKTMSWNEARRIAQAEISAAMQNIGEKARASVHIVHQEDHISKAQA